MSDPRKPILESDVLKDFLEVQKSKIKNDAIELQIKKDDLDNQFKYAKESLLKNFLLLKDKPKQDRFTIITYGAIIFIFLTIFLGFLIWLIQAGKDKLVETILIWIGRIVLIGISFFLGRLSKSNSNSNDNISDPVEVIED